ncbi:MAG: ribonuclease P protein component [Gammaproteobacteria bacterium]|nr:ribonuclease P protein component [Gammaproteobacteria bacterium]MAY02922.1 ribonuclease P protein component [Gammaproteobacteria bacterium]
MTKQGFPKTSRLLNASQFGPVFRQTDIRVSTSNLLILARLTGEPARLGIVVAKKHIRLAVQRNRIKRLIRESFRIRRQEFATMDLVVLARPKLDELTNQQVCSQLNQLFDRLIAKFVQQAK